MPLQTKLVIACLEKIENFCPDDGSIDVVLTQQDFIAIGQAAEMLRSGLLPIENKGIKFDPYSPAIDPSQDGRDQATDRILSEELHLQRYEMMIQQQQITINQLISLLSLALNKGT